jgi:hypothetical protein
VVLVGGYSLLQRDQGTDCLVAMDGEWADGGQWPRVSGRAFSWVSLLRMPWGPVDYVLLVSLFFLFVLFQGSNQGPMVAGSSVHALAAVMDGTVSGPTL